MMVSKYLTTEEVAELLRTSPETCRFWRHEGRGPEAFKVGRRVLYAARTSTRSSHEPETELVWVLPPDWAYDPDALREGSEARHVPNVDAGALPAISSPLPRPTDPQRPV